MEICAPRGLSFIFCGDLWGVGYIYIIYHILDGVIWVYYILYSGWWYSGCGCVVGGLYYGGYIMVGLLWVWCVGCVGI